MSRSRHERDYERGGRGRDYEVDREREREKDRDRDRYRDRERERSRERGTGRERERERGRERGGSRDRDRGREKERFRGGSRERSRERNRGESERGGSRDRSRGEKERGVSRDGDGGGRHHHHHRDHRHGDEEMKPVKRLRSKSPRPEQKEDTGSRPPRVVDSERDTTRSPHQVADAAANEDVSAVTGNQQPSEDDVVGKMEAAKAALEAKEKEKAQPTFEYSGKLAAETNKVRGITLAFVEPPEARKPTTRWRLYVFKDGEPLNEPLYIHRQTCYLFGRERRVADVPTDHPSCSKQHAVIQYRLTELEGPDGMMQNKVRPYIMDLGSTNGTFLNNTRIEAQRYHELREKDTLKFGNSSREYVLLHENSAGAAS
ncbi:hypothetical protein M758_8G019700 [Ceratodon purpureus]|nr:hypothetical protein M758_8G019700 [Ceratodon purpureus]